MKFLRLISIVAAILFLAQATRAQNIEYQGSTLWNGISEAKIDGNYAYCAFANGLVILDISDPSNQIEIGHYFLQGMTIRICVSGNYALLTNYYPGNLTIIDISDRSQPMYTGSFSGPGIHGIIVRGNYAYLGAIGGLKIIDISHPTNPTLVGTCTFDSELWDLALNGNYIYAADFGNALRIINISDLSHPVLVGSCDLPGNAYGISLQGNYAYVAIGDLGMETIDISSPTNPTIVGNYDSPFSTLGVVVRGSYAYLAHPGLPIIDVSNPSNPSYVRDGIPGNLDAITLADDRLFLTYSNLRIADISNPIYPTLLGVYQVPGSIVSVAVAGSYAYAIDNYYGLHIVDVSDHSSPTIVGNYISTPGFCDISVVGHYAFMAKGGDGLIIVDISNSMNPTLTSTYNTPGGALGVFVQSPYAYVADGLSGLEIINIADLSNPALIGNCNFQGDAQDVFIQGNYAYIAAGDSELQIINVLDPTHPVRTGHCGGGAYAYKIAVAGIYAYLADVYHIMIYNISNPFNPVLIHGFNSSGGPDIQVLGHYAFLGECEIWNVSNPSYPNRIGFYELPGGAWDIFTLGTSIFVADDFSLVILTTNLVNIDDSNIAPTVFSLS